MSGRGQYVKSLEGIAGRVCKARPLPGEGLAKEAHARNFVRAIRMMVHEYGKKVVGKGIEDTATLALLKGMGVDLVQGFYLGRRRGRSE